MELRMSNLRPSKAKPWILIREWELILWVILDLQNKVKKGRQNQGIKTEAGWARCTPILQLTKISTQSRKPMT